MSATVSTHQHQRRVPLATALAIAGVITAAGALGFAWEQSHDSAKPVETPALRTPTAQDYSQYNYYHGQKAGIAEQQDGVSKAGPNDFENAQVAEQAQGEARAGSNGVTNAQVSEHQEELQKFTSPPGGKVQLGE
jgi:hypothetical protein